MNERDKHEIATMKVMTPYIIPFLKGRKTCIECMVSIGVPEDEATSIVDKVCKEANDLFEWSEKQDREDIIMARTKKGKEALMIKALREVQGVTEDELSDDRAKELIGEVEKEASRLGLI